MILTYKECIKKYGSDYMIKKAIEDGKLFQKEKGLYCTTKYCSDLELISSKYPRGTFVAESAYYYYGLTDTIPEHYHIATKREDTRIKDKNIKQMFINVELYDLGKTKLEYQGVKINIYDKERLLIDLIRFKSKVPFDYYKEIIINYRLIIDQLDFYKLENYVSQFKNSEKIMNTIQLEVL